jgi:hypothetical protein
MIPVKKRSRGALHETLVIGNLPEGATPTLLRSLLEQWGCHQVADISMGSAPEGSFATVRLPFRQLSKALSHDGEALEGRLLRVGREVPPGAARSVEASQRAQQAGAAFAEQWLSRAGEKAVAAAFESFPKLPAWIDAPLLRFAETSLGSLRQAQALREAVRRGFWKPLLRGRGNAGGPRLSAFAKGGDD